MVENGKLDLFRESVDEILYSHLKRLFSLHILKGEVKLNRARNTSKIVMFEKSLKY